MSDDGQAYVVRVKHSGPMSSDRDEHPVVFGPASKAVCQQACDDMNHDWSPGSTSWRYVAPA